MIEAERENVWDAATDWPATKGERLANLQNRRKSNKVIKKIRGHGQIIVCWKKDKNCASTIWPGTKRERPPQLKKKVDICIDGDEEEGGKDVDEEG